MPAWHDATVVHRDEVGPELVTLTLSVPAAVREGFTLPGQFHRLQPHGVPEAFFALASAPGEEHFEYLVKRGGATADALAALKPGASLKVSELEGTGFPMLQARGRHVLMVGTGTGFAPLRSALKAIAARRNDFLRVHAAWGITTPEHLAWKEELDPWRARGLDVQPVCLQPDEEWKGARGLVQDMVRTWTGASSVAFLCGHQEMVREVKELLAARGLPPERVFLNY